MKGCSCGKVEKREYTEANVDDYKILLNVNKMLLYSNKLSHAFICCFLIAIIKFLVADEEQKFHPVFAIKFNLKFLFFFLQMTTNLLLQIV